MNREHKSDYLRMCKEGPVQTQTSIIHSDAFVAHPLGNNSDKTRTERKRDKDGNMNRQKVHEQAANHRQTHPQRYNHLAGGTVEFPECPKGQYSELR
jgi:hypothetical protein